MIIEKGYSLKQFVDFVKNKQHDELVVSFEKAQVIKLKWIYQYCDILKRNIDRNMFDIHSQIFDGKWIETNNDSLGFNTILISNGKVCFEFYEDGDIIFMDDENFEHNIKTLEDLFNVYPAKMKLININVF